MTKLTTAELIDAFREMTVLELAEFTAAFEGRFGVSAQTAVTVSPDGPADPDVGDEEDVQDEFDVFLEKVGDQKIQVIKAARALTGLGLKEAKDLVESAPVAVLKGAGAEAAARAKADLESAGAVAALR
jgi:large subunit ribosomal protein L7/L12